MAEDIFKPAGATKASKPDAGGAVIRNVPVIGIVKNNIDPTRAGRIQVYISDLGGDDPDNAENWATVSYMPPFYGFVQPTAGTTGDGDYVANPASYGMWFSPPDLETEVICMFINGDPNYGFYMGAIPKPEALHMVPAIGSSENIITNNNSEASSYGGATILPVTNINTNNVRTSNDNNFLDLPKPIHSYQAAIFFKQGLIRDSIRGPITSSANRESPSRVGWGVSTPGKPIYAGGYTDASIAEAALQGRDTQGLQVISRLGGHSIVLDDGDLIGRNNLMRLRSSAGHQITMSDDGQTIFIIHSNGQSYIELGKEGTVDIFSTNSFNVRTQGDLNLHADNDINIHAKKKLNIKAEEINIFSENNTTHRIGADYKIETAGKYNLKVAGIMSLGSGDTASFASGGTTFINGSKINLNTGSGPKPDAVGPIVDKLATDTLFTSPQGYLAAPAILKTITSRAPAHAPWANANQGANVETSPSAEDNLPSSPTPEASSIVTQASTTSITNPVTPAALSSVPNVSSISEGLDSTTSGSIISATAVNAATGPASAAVAAGSGIVNTSAGPTAALGKLAQSPKQLETAGFLKPGSSVLVDSLISSGTPINSALPSNVFTGKKSVNNLPSFIGNQDSQLSSMVSNLQKSQTLLTKSGLITGREDPAVLAGLVLACSANGLDATLNVAKQNTSQRGIPKAGVPRVNSSVINAVNSGKSAASSAQLSTGGLGSIFSTLALVGTVAVASKGNSKGVQASAISAIASSFLPLPQKRPANLGSISRQNMAIAESRNSGITQTIGQAADLLKLAGRLGGPGVNSVSTALRGGLTSINKILNAKTTAQQISGTTGTVNSVGRLGTLAGNRSIAKTARQVNSVVRATDQITKSLTKFNNAKTIQRQLGEVGRIANSVGSVAGVLGNKSLRKDTQKIGTLARSTSSVATANNRIATSKNINTTLGAVNQIIRNASRIRGIFSNSQRSSGMSMLPGGNLSVNSVVNKSLGKAGVPRNPALTAIITSAATAALNNVLYPKSLQSSRVAGRSIAGGLASSGSGAFSNFQDDIVKTIGNLQASKGGLAKTALANLPPGEAEALNAATSSIGFGGAGALQLPTIGENTFNSSSVDSQLSGLLEDSRIPDIDYGSEPDPAGINALEKAIQQNNQIDNELTNLSQLQEQINQAREEYFTLENTLLPGDPILDQARNDWLQLQNQADQLLTKIDNIIND